MKITQITFSPTGGTQKVADILSEALGGPVSRIDLTRPHAGDAAPSWDGDGLAVIAVPSYGGRVPALAAERLAAIDGRQARCVLVCVYGNRAYEDTLLELSDIARAQNFQVIAAVAAVAEHSIVRQYGAGRPDERDGDELRGFAQAIRAAVEGQGGPAPLSALPGSRPYRQTGRAGLLTEAGEGCVRCGLCARNCPAQAIHREDVRVVDGEACISCMRCVAQCPRAARHVDEAQIAAIAQALRSACAGRKANELFLG